MAAEDPKTDPATHFFCELINLTEMKEKGLLHAETSHPEEYRPKEGSIEFRHAVSSGAKDFVTTWKRVSFFMRG